MLFRKKLRQKLLEDSGLVCIFAALTNRKCEYEEDCLYLYAGLAADRG